MFVKETFYIKCYIIKVNTTLQQPYKIILAYKYQSELPDVSNFVKKQLLS